MAKKYQDRAMSTAPEKGEVFFFPKENPPVSIRAMSREEAEEKLEASKSKENG